MENRNFRSFQRENSYFYCKGIASASGVIAALLALLLVRCRFELHRYHWMQKTFRMQKLFANIGRDSAWPVPIWTFFLLWASFAVATVSAFVRKAQDSRLQRLICVDLDTISAGGEQTLEEKSLNR